MNTTLGNTPSWVDELKDSVIKKHIQLVVFCYTIIKDKIYPNIPIENTRRNTLIRAMRQYRTNFGVLSTIASESGQFNDEDEDIGRIDIVCYFDMLREDNCIAFECKRFLKNDITSSRFQAKFVGQGIQRFQDNKYSENAPVAGMIAFVESGDYTKAYNLFLSELPKTLTLSPMTENSDQYKHNYIFNTVHTRKNNSNIELTHILMDFTHNNYSLSS